MAKKRADTPEKTVKKRGFFANFFEPLDAGDESGEDYLEDEPEIGEEPPEKEKKKKKKHRSIWELANEDYEDDPPEKAPKKKPKPPKDEPKHTEDESDELTITKEPPADLTAAPAPKEPETPKPESAPEKIQLFDDGDALPGDAPNAPSGGVHEDEDIRLFDHDDYVEDTEEGQKRPRGTRAAIISTGTGTAARVHINETEELQRAEKAQKERREREANRQHQEYVSKQQLKKQRKRMFRRAAGNIAFGGLIVIGVLLSLYYAFLLSDIVIAGNETYSSDYIIEQSGLKFGQHMLTVDLDEAKAGIEEDPYLQVDSITYIFPSRVRIAITERKEAAGIIGLDYNVIIDDSGYVLAMGAGTDISKLLQVTGVNMTGFQIGQRLGEGDDFSTATLISMIEKLEANNLMGNIKSIDLTTPLATTMTATNGLEIFVGQPTDLDAKFLSLKAELPTFLKQNIYWGTLYLSAKGGTVYSPRTMAEILAAGTTGDGTGDAGGATDPNYVNPDLDGDGYDDLTGAIITYAPTATPDPGTAGGGNVIVGAGGDDFQG